MTSGMSAKGSALGANVPEGGVVSSRAPLPRAPGNGTKRSRESDTGTNFQEAGITDTPETSHPALSSSVRTLILGIDYDGRIVQHDRNADRILARKPEDLLGAQLIGEAWPVERVAEEDQGLERVLGCQQAGDPAAEGVTADRDLGPRPGLLEEDRHRPQAHRVFEAAQELVVAVINKAEKEIGNATHEFRAVLGVNDRLCCRGIRRR